MTTTNANAITLAEALAVATDYGRKEGAAGNLKHEMAIKLAELSSAGAIDPAKTSDDIEAWHDAYLQGKRGASYKPEDENKNSRAKAMSQWRALARCGVHPSTEGVRVLEDALRLSKDMTTGRSVYQGLVDVAVKQNESEAAFTEDDITKVLTPKTDEAEAKTEAEMIEAALTSLGKIRDGAEATDKTPARPAYVSPELQVAIAALEKRLAEITPAKDVQLAALLTAGVPRSKALKALGMKRAA